MLTIVGVPPVKCKNQDITIRIGESIKSNWGPLKCADLHEDPKAIVDPSLGVCTSPCKASGGDQCTPFDPDHENPGNRRMCLCAKGEQQFEASKNCFVCCKNNDCSAQHSGSDNLINVRLYLVLQWLAVAAVIAGPTA